MIPLAGCVFLVSLAYWILCIQEAECRLGCMAGWGWSRSCPLWGSSHVNSGGSKTLAFTVGNWMLNSKFCLLLKSAFQCHLPLPHKFYLSSVLASSRCFMPSKTIGFPARQHASSTKYVFMITLRNKSSLSLTWVPFKILDFFFFLVIRSDRRESFFPLNVNSPRFPSELLMFGGIVAASTVWTLFCFSNLRNCQDWSTEGPETLKWWDEIICKIH